MIGTVTPTRPVRPPDNARALRLVEKPCSWTTFSTASRVSGATSGRSLSTRETVAIETPAALATSRIVVRGFGSEVSAEAIGVSGQEIDRKRLRQTAPFHTREESASR